MKAADTEQAIIDAMAADDWEQVARLEAQLDTPAKPAPRLGPAALWYAKAGLKVFPLQPRSKLPYKGSHGFEDATTDAAVIRGLWLAYPNANIGLATGHLVDVIDIDGREGATSWAHVTGLPEPLGIVRTPRGRHIYIPAAGKGNRAGIFPGIDYRGLGGYVVAPPSVNQDGVTYAWRRPLDLATVT
jgi:hypothetical protein